MTCKISVPKGGDNLENNPTITVIKSNNRVSFNYTSLKFGPVYPYDVTVGNQVTFDDNAGTCFLEIHKDSFEKEITDIFTEYDLSDVDNGEYRIQPTYIEFEDVEEFGYPSGYGTEITIKTFTRCRTLFTVEKVKTLFDYNDDVDYYEGPGISVDDDGFAEIEDIEDDATDFEAYLNFTLLYLPSDDVIDVCTELENSDEL